MKIDTTGLLLSLNQVGKCFSIDCCNWEARESDDICGLDTNRLTVAEKVRSIIDNSVLKESFAKAGL